MNNSNTNGARTHPSTGYRTDPDFRRRFLKRLATIPLKNPVLIDVDPFGPGMTTVTQQMVLKECRDNILYFVLLCRIDRELEKHVSIDDTTREIADKFKRLPESLFATAFAHFLETSTPGMIPVIPKRHGRNTALAAFADYRENIKL